MLRRSTATFLAATVVAVAGCATAAGNSADRRQAHLAATSATLTVQSSTIGRPVPRGFLGLSMETWGLASYEGSDPNAVNPVFEQLLRNLSPGQGMVLRIGGQSTERSWYPVPHMAKPLGVRYTLTPAWMRVTRALAQSLGARLILPINLEVTDTRVGAAEARAMLAQIGRPPIQALEVGNEPEQYGSFPWYQNPPGVHHLGRPRSYDFSAYLGDFSRMVRVLPSAPLAGPSTGAPTWMPQLGRFLSSEPRVAMTTIHRYPLKQCGHGGNVTIAQLLSNAASAGLANGIARYVGVAHSHHVPLRVDEMNGVSCGGERGVSNTFGSALWALDTLFSMQRVGVDGVNLHTQPGEVNELFSAERGKSGAWQSFVHPQYYGMMMFAQAAPAGAQLLRITGTTASQLRAWATRSADGHIRVVLIDKYLAQPANIKLRIPGATGPATIERLQAPHTNATSGVTLGGQSFGRETTTGKLAGPERTTSLAPAAGEYSVRMTPASAVLLTLSTH